MQWDQRGAGKTYMLNDPNTVGPTMTPERLIRDTGEVVTWVRGQLGKDKIFVWGIPGAVIWGCSWRSGIRSGYMPIWARGRRRARQRVSGKDGTSRWPLPELRTTKAIAELQAIAPYPGPGPGKPVLEHAMTNHEWIDYFGGVMAYRTSQEDESHAVRLSPDYSDAEAPHIYDGNGYSERYLFAFVLGVDLSRQMQLHCPLILLEGRHDHVVSSEVAP